VPGGLPVALRGGLDNPAKWRVRLSRLAPSQAPDILAAAGAYAALPDGYLTDGELPAGLRAMSAPAPPSRRPCATRELTHKATGRTIMRPQLFSNVQIFDGEGTDPYPGEVLVEGNRIRAVARGTGPLLARDGAEEIDGGGNTLMPGLTEGHAHVTSPTWRS